MKSLDPADVTTRRIASGKALETSKGGAALGPAVSFLRADDPQEHAAWLELWNAWPGREIMAHPDYARLFARPSDRVYAAVARTRAGGILYPMILRPLAAEPWASKEADLWDATTPYGYGGPFAWNLAEDEGSLFWDAVDAWAMERHVITAFARLPLFPESLLPFRGPVEVSGPCIVRQLDLPEEEIWADYSPKVRQNVQRARRLGLTVETDPSGSHLDEFIEIYTETMRRRGAAASYYFPRSFFESFARDLKDHSLFFHARNGKRIVSSELLLFSRDHAYSFLGGSLEEAFMLRANDLLKHESFLWCREAGKKTIVLGGGYRGQDGILKYKRTFARSGEVPFKLGKKTYDAAARDRLVQLRLEAAQAAGTPWQPDPLFFPSYRS